MNIMRHAALLAASATLAFSAPVMAQDEYPLVGGDWVEVSGIDIADGHSLDYANHLAGMWRKGQDFAKSQGWITDYEILANVHPRVGEPDLYLMTRFPKFADQAENERRGKAYRAMMKSTISDMEKASGDRAEYRTLMSDLLLQELKWRK
jgi:hypothetical protein